MFLQPFLGDQRPGAVTSDNLKTTQSPCTRLLVAKE